ncbi:MAG TPA: phasin family protein [Noviherbaspirillum sp.]
MTSKAASHTHRGDEDLAEAARKSVDLIWQAGLGAFARARQEGGDMFSRLVEEGAAVQKRTRRLAEDRFEEMGSTIAKMADSFGKQASGSLDKLETVFEDRVTRSLQHLGLPTRDDIKALSVQITRLQEGLDALTKKQLGKPGATKSVEAAAKQPSAKAGKSSASAAKRGTNVKRARGATSARV